MFLHVAESHAGSLLNLLLFDTFLYIFADNTRKVSINDKVYKIFALGNSAVSEVAGEGLTLPVSD